MNPIDIRDLALNLSDLLGGLDSHRTRGPLLVTRDGQPEAVIIRHKVYAPKLDAFEVTTAGDLTCRKCGAGVLVPNPYNLGSAADAANQHWRDAHRGTAV